MSAAPQTPYEALGGRAVVDRIVDRFYDLMDSDPAYRQLRALHAEDLAPMRHSLSGFLTAWSGGPRDWFTEKPGRCVMSAHSSIPINAETATQWMTAMTQAITDSGIDARLANSMVQALQGMASGMAR